MDLQPRDAVDCCDAALGKCSLPSCGNNVATGIRRYRLYQSLDPAATVPDVMEGCVSGLGQVCVKRCTCADEL